MKLLLDENLSRLKIPNRSKTVVLNILLDHHTEIEQALIEHNRACVEISPSNR